MRVKVASLLGLFFLILGFLLILNITLDIFMEAPLLYRLILIVVVLGVLWYINRHRKLRKGVQV